MSPKHYLLLDGVQMPYGKGHLHVVKKISEHIQYKMYSIKKFKVQMLLNITEYGIKH